VHPLAQELNEILTRENPAVPRLLSARGKRLFFPRGIVSQSQEAKAKAHWVNATIGIATDGAEPLYLPCIQKYFNDLPPRELYPYAPVAGRKDLRKAWLEKMRRENPALADRTVSLPVATNALTHALSILGDLFIDPGDVILLPDKYWGNYRLIFEVRLEARLQTYPLYSPGGGFNSEGLAAALAARPAGSKTVVLLNFPNNPTGYSPTREEGEKTVSVLTEAARDRDLLVVVDDAYFGLLYEESCLKESLFGLLCDASERLLAAKADGATKEEFVWGFRCGFLTFGIKGGSPELYAALEKKTGGAIRGNISNASHVAQSIVLRALRDPAFPAEQHSTREILAERARKVKEVVHRPRYQELWEVYPFNAGYFMCLKLKEVRAEALRVHLLESRGLGVIAAGERDLRVAFSCVPVEKIEEVFEAIAAGIEELRS